MIENKIRSYAMTHVFMDDTDIQVSIQDMIDDGYYDFVDNNEYEIEILTNLDKKFELVEGNNGLVINNFELELKCNDEVYLCTSSKCVKK